jgi:hypothetical protein
MSRSRRVALAAIVAMTVVLVAAPRAPQAQRKSPFSDPIFQTFEPPAWWNQEHRQLLPRWWLAPTYARFPAEGFGLGGLTIGFGFERYRPDPFALTRWVLGSAFGVEARGHLLRDVDGARTPWLAAAGLALTSNVVESRLRILWRVRFPSLVGLLVPEAGVAARGSAPSSLYTRWSVPLATLVTKQFAVEAIPSAMVLYRGARGDVETVWLFGVGISWRALGERMQLH